MLYAKRQTGNKEKIKVTSRKPTSRHAKIALTLKVMSGLFQQNKLKS